MPIIRGEITETVDISTNGTHNVARYTSANVRVQPNISSLNVTPTTSAQQITAPQGTDGYSPVNVSAVTSSIDANITAGNIKKDVTILGVTGSYEGGGGSAPTYYIEKTVDANGKLQTTPNIINMNGATDVGVGVLSYAYYGVSFPANTGVSIPLITISGMAACRGMFFGCRGFTSANLSALTTVSGDSACENMFLNCIELTSADLSALTTISGNNGCYCMFQDCIELTSADLSALTTVSGVQGCANMFFGCSGLTSADLSALTTLSGDSACSFMFSSCSGLTSADLSALTTVSSNYACEYMFSGCTSLATVYIGGTTAITFGEDPSSVFNYMFDGCSQNIDVYAPAANQAQIEAFSDYPNFGGTGTVTWHWRS